MEEKNKERFGLFFGPVVVFRGCGDENNPRKLPPDVHGVTSLLKIKPDKDRRVFLVTARS